MSPAGSKNAPEAKARVNIDDLLSQSGWLVQVREDMNFTASDDVDPSSESSARHLRQVRIAVRFQPVR
jgi:hypothetical protein